VALAETLAKVHAEIEAGRLYQARDRLHGLIQSYPDEYTLRWLLGDVYWRLNYPAMAGRYWWLYPPERPEVSEAVEAFAKICGGIEPEMSRRSRPYLDPNALPEGPAKNRTKELLSGRADTAEYPSTKSTRRANGCMGDELITGCFFLVCIFAILGILLLISRLLAWLF